MAWGHRRSSGYNSWGSGSRYSSNYNNSFKKRKKAEPKLTKKRTGLSPSSLPARSPPLRGLAPPPFLLPPPYHYNRVFNLTGLTIAKMQADSVGKRVSGTYRMASCSEMNKTKNGGRSIKHNEKHDFQAHVYTKVT